MKALPKGLGNNHLKTLACLQRHDFCKPTSELGAKLLIISWHLMHMAKEKVDQCLSEFVWAQACKIRKGLALMDNFQVSTKGGHRTMISKNQMKEMLSFPFFFPV